MREWVGECVESGGMNGWMNECMDGWRSEWMYGWMDG